MCGSVMTAQKSVGADEQREYVGERSNLEWAANHHGWSLEAMGRRQLLFSYSNHVRERVYLDSDRIEEAH